MYHIDTDVERAMIALADALCMWERNTGRKSTLIFIPHQPDEQIAVLENGKPMHAPTPAEILIALADAQAERPFGLPLRALLQEVTSRYLSMLVDLDKMAREGG